MSPKRLDNGYRDYSEEDVRTLEKIKLLRQLQLDIDTIRKVQGGVLTLDQALFVQATKLEGDRAMVERAAQVCRELQQTCVEYAALEPQPWLCKLEAPQQPKLPEPPSVAPTKEDERDSEPRACYCPWQRYFARTLDVLLYDTLINVLWLVLLHDFSLWRFQTSPIGGLVFGLLMLVLALALEPLWLHFLGWTPGKWLFGLKLRDEDGDRLTLSQAWERSWRVFQDGYGWYIPIWHLWKMWQCRKLGLDGRDCWWDAEEDYRYTKVERRFNTAVVYVLTTLALLGGQMAALKGAELPINRGALTVAEFSRNYNHFQSLLYDSDGYGDLPKLDKDGQWVEPAEPSYKSEVLINGVWVDEADIATRWDQPEYTLDDGRVTAVTLHWESRQAYQFSGGIRETLALLALSGSTQGTDLFHYDLADWLEAELFSSWGDSETDYRGLHISQQMEFTGYHDDGTFLFATEGEDQYCEKTVTISLIE